MRFIYKLSIAVLAITFLCVPFEGHPSAVSGVIETPRDDVRNARMHNYAGVDHLAKKDFAAARILFLRAIDLDATVKFYHNNIAVACMNLGMYREAVVHLEKAINLDQNYARALSNMAICCFHLAEYRKAYGFYRRASTADRPYMEERFSLAKVITGMEKIHRENPDNTALKSIIREVKGLERMP